jgi:hypothetical protein
MQLRFRFGSGQTLQVPFADFQGGLCAYVFSATDLNGDRRDELAIDVSSGGASGLEEFFRVDPDGIRPLLIAEPGDPPYVEPDRRSSAAGSTPSCRARSSAE